ncbi:MAG: response regulator transcription factor [Sphingobacteriales bacterium]|nr:MAG: response regulator transcription factor [Sphingobacteriales bacterium]
MKSKTRCVIIDDEQHAITLLTHYISSMPNLELYKTYRNPLLALSEISKDDDVDIIFLDIEMPDITGLELSKELKRKTEKIVFTTGYTKYGYAAFEADGDGYLLKPYSFSKFAGVINKLFPERRIRELRDYSNEFYFIKDKGNKTSLRKVKVTDIVYLEGSENYVKLGLIDGTQLLTYNSLNELSSIFTEPKGFFRFQRSFLVNIEHITAIDGYMLRMLNNKTISVGRNYKVFHITGRGVCVDGSIIALSIRCEGYTISFKRLVRVKQDPSLKEILKLPILTVRLNLLKAVNQL